MMPSLSPLLITTLLLLPMLGMVSAATIDINGVEEPEPEDGDARTVFTSGGTYYIALNTTFLLYYSVLAGALLLALLALSGAFNSAESTSGYGQQYGYQQQYQQRAGAEEGYRNKRQAYSSDFTDQLHLLADAFNKYEVNETTCQLYVACESAHTHLHEKHGKLAKIVHQVMKNIEKPENMELYQDDAYLMDILEASRLGLRARAAPTSENPVA